ncbi:hypothetical protein ACWCV9_05965 [Streptomyces sp. NPDC001606]
MSAVSLKETFGIDHRGTDPLIDRVDALIGNGYIGEEKAARIAVEVPEAGEKILDWLRAMVSTGDWHRFERFAAVALHLHPDGLAEILLDALTSGKHVGRASQNSLARQKKARRVNEEDLVEFLGELHAQEAVGALGLLLQERMESDAPYFSLCIKIIQSLGDIDTPEAQDVLRSVASGDWPKPLKWHAAEELGIEEELGFDEDEMLGGA